MFSSKKFPDALGHALMDFFNGEREPHIIERDDGYIEAMSADFYFSKYKNWPPRERSVLKNVKGRILDIGCGAGRHSLYLQQKDFDVTAIDKSPLAIKVCKLRGLKKARVMSIEEISGFKPSSFDSIIMMFNNFGLFGNPQKAKVLLRKFYKISSDNALIFTETNNIYKTIDPDHLSYHKFNLKRHGMAGQIRLRVRYKKLIDPWFDYLMVSKSELREILKNTGWKVRKFIDSRNPKKPQYIAIIEKIKNAAI